MDKPLVASIVVAVATSSSIPVQADIVDFYLGAAVWQASVSGEAQDGATLIDIEDDLGLDDDTSNFFYARLEHFLPILPHVAVQHTDIGFDASNLLVTEIDFEGETFTVGETVNSSADLTHTDLTVYWELFDFIAELDLGISARFFDGEIQLQSDSIGSVQEDLDDPIPMLYARVAVNLPLTGLSASVTGQGIGFEGDVIYDANARINYESFFGLGIEAGYRVLDFDVDDADILADFTIDGAYVGLSYHF